jgi:hypothetical protein
LGGHILWKLPIPWGQSQQNLGTPVRALGGTFFENMMNKTPRLPTHNQRKLQAKRKSIRKQKSKGSDLQRRAPTDPTQEKRKKSVEESIDRSIEIFRRIADEKNTQM